MRYLTPLLLFLFFTPINSSAQTDDALLRNIEELLDEALVTQEEEAVSVASQVLANLREAPSAVTVFTAEQIQALGVRDMLDLMSFVPGFEISQDYGNVRNVCVRGNATGEGKILLLLDGHLINETTYGFAAFGQRFPVYLIERVEIIRGPGSASYGGFAGLAVVSVTTKAASKKTGGQLHSQVEISEKDVLRQTSDFWLGYESESGGKFATSGFYSRGNISNATVQNPQGKTINFGDSSDVESYFGNVDAQYKGWNLNVMYEHYRMRRTESEDKRTVFGGVYVRTSKDFTFAEDFTLTPTLNWKSQEPWNVYEGPQEDYILNNRQWQPNLKLLWQPTPKFYLMLGTEYYHIRARYVRENVTDAVFANGERDFMLNSTAIFGEAFYRTPWANFTFGARYENHNIAGEAFVPRLSVTKSFGNFHYKLLFNRAFRTPSIYNIELSEAQKISPERIQAFEAELGYTFDKRGGFTLNLFDMTVDDNIVYLDNATVLGAYVNAERSGTRGLEFEGQLNLNDNLGVIFNYAFYTPNFREVDQFNLPEQDFVNQGLSGHKLNAHLSWQPVSSLVITPSMTYRSARFVRLVNAEGDFFTFEHDPYLGLNLNLEWRNVLQRGLHVQLTGYNLLNSLHWYPLAYTTGVNHLPFSRRSVGLRVLYQWQRL